MPLVATPGAANANSYATIAEIEAYIAEQVEQGTWPSLTTPQKEGVAIMATRLLDAMPQAWTGSPAEATAAVQALRWPRDGMFNRNGQLISSAVIPADLKIAQAEFAKQLAVDASRLEDNDIEKLGITSIGVGSISLAFAQKDKTGLLVPENAQAELAVQNFVPDLVRALLVPSWLLESKAQVLTSPFLFEAL